MTKTDVKYEIYRHPMIGDTLFNPVCEPDQEGKPWDNIDVSVLKYENDCLVDEVHSVDGIRDFRISEGVVWAYKSLYPEASINDQMSLSDIEMNQKQNLSLDAQIEQRVLDLLYDLSSIELFYWSKYIAERLEIKRPYVKTALRELCKKGLCECLHGLVNEDTGMLAGSGYAITEKGIQYCVELTK